MEPIQPMFNEEYTTPVRSIEMVDPQQTLVRSIWRNQLGQDLYEKNNFNQPLFDPPHASTTTGVDVG
jgi:hypothetical protein